MFPVFTSRAPALTLSFLFAAVLVYSQSDLCLEDDLLISLQNNREAAEQFCRAELQVPDIYTTYLGTTLRRTATALVTTIITVSISALTVPSSTRTITLGPIGTTSVNANRKRAPKPTDYAPFLEAVPDAREVADGSAEDDLILAFSSACNCLYLEPRTISVPQTITTTRTLTARPRLTTTRYRRTVTAGISTVTIRTILPLTTRTISLIPIPTGAGTGLSTVILPASSGLSTPRVVIVPSASPTLSTNITSFFASLSSLTSRGTIIVSGSPTLTANSTSFSKTLPPATSSGRIPVSSLPFPLANSTRPLSSLLGTSRAIVPSASPAPSTNITIPSGSPAISANSTRFSFSAVLSPATSTGTIIPPRSANTSNLLRPTAFPSSNSSFPTTLIATGIPHSTKSPTPINGSIILSSTSLNTSRVAVASLALASPAIINGNAAIDLLRLLELSSSCFSLGLYPNPTTASISVVTTTVFITPTFSSIKPPTTAQNAK